MIELCCGEDARRVFLAEVRWTVCLNCWHGWCVYRPVSGEVKEEARDALLERFADYPVKVVAPRRRRTGWRVKPEDWADIVKALGGPLVLPPGGDDG